MRTLRIAIPAGLFVGIIALLWHSLYVNAETIPSPFINKPTPAISLPTLDNSELNVTNDIFKGKVSLLNIWATWCSACAVEHPILLALSRDPQLTIYGLDYKDDDAKAKIWLNHYGNPYREVFVDKDGKTAIDWGVYGTPETFLIDKKGIIRYKHIGAVTEQVWQEKLQPLITKLQQET